MSAEPIDEKAVFNLARRIDGRQARADYLQQVCGAHPEALQRVLELLRVHEQEQSFLESPAVAMNVTIDQPLAEKPGTQIGPYKLLQEIGHGGMGVVYMAEQHEPVRRRVALKIIKPGMDTRQVIARFEAERQALSLMDHPNIAKVLDAGATESGRPYFVMELVKGQPITQYCDEHRLAPHQRLELMLPVCQAIQHAHQKGIIHRDIKPTNILVAEYDQQPVPKVIDFGVAKATSQALTEKTMFTGYGQIVGTLEYMSPEQAKVNQLDIDTRSDIYSLGVLLYELLTGSTPFDHKRLRSAAFDEMLRIIRDEEPPKPSTRITESKDSLPSVSAQRKTEPKKLSTLVRGELDWIVMKAMEKDRAHRYETVNGLTSDIRRYLDDEPVVACPPSVRYRFSKFARRHKGGLVTAATIGVALLTGSAVSTWQAIRATHAADSERQARQDAEEARRQEELYRHTATEAKTAAQQEAAKASQNYEIARRSVGSISARVAIEQLSAEVRQRLLADAKLFYTELCQQNSQDALAYYERGQVNEWLKEFDSARDDYEKATELQPNNAGAHRALALLCWNCPDENKRDFNSALQHMLIAIRLNPENSLYHHDLAAVYVYLGERQKARDEFLQAVELLPPGAWQYNLRARACMITGDIRGAIVWAKKAIDVAPEIPDCKVQLANYYSYHGEYAEAVVEVTKAIDHWSAQGWFPDWDRSLVYAYAVRGAALEKMGKYSEALEDYNELVALVPSSSNFRRQRGLVELRLGNYERALADFAKALDLQPVGTRIPRIIPLQLVAKASDERLRSGMLELSDKAIALQPGVASGYADRARLHATYGQRELALADFNRALQLDSSNTDAWSGRAVCYAEMGQWERAVDDFKKAVATDPNEAVVCHDLARSLATYHGQGEWMVSHSLELAQKAISLASRERWEYDSFFQEGAYWNTLGLALYRAKQWETAVDAIHKAQEMRGGGDASDLFLLAMALGQRGDKDEARAWYAKAIAWIEKHEPDHEELRALRREAEHVLDIPEPR